MSFRSVFIAITIATALVLSAIIINHKRPGAETQQPNAEFIKAAGKCAECHRQATPGIVYQFEQSHHAKEGINCLDCHAPTEGQTGVEHKGFTISEVVTPKNCAMCHNTQYKQYLRSRHAAPAYAAVLGSEDFTEEQIAFAEKFHPGTVKRPANALAKLEGEAATKVGCLGCHDIGQPNADGSIGKCTECHGRHNASIELSRTPELCGQCHMGPDHAQMEIYNESKHGVLYNAQRDRLNLAADPTKLTTKDMSVPTCATCHMSGLEGQKFTHDTTERLSYWLFAPISKKRPNFEQGQLNMKETCAKCHSTDHIENFYADAEAVVIATNERITAAKKIIDDLRAEGLLTPEPFDEPMEFLYFDIWHYFGRTAKHGAFMGGPDFVQWHGNYELLLKLKEMEEMAEEIREKKGKTHKAVAEGTEGAQSY